MSKPMRTYATGRRKTATARVFISPGTGKLSVNHRDASEYFRRSTLLMILNQPFELTDTTERYDVYVTVRGGGLSGQAGAVKHGISRCLNRIDTEKYRPVLKRAGFLTRDPRVVERKKYGRPKARKRFQFSKR